MSEIEVERLVVRLTGDGSEYQKTLKQAQVNTQQATDRIGQMVSSLVGNATSALAALGLGSWLKGGLSEWQLAESTALKLEAALKSNGREVERTMASYNRFATQMEELTVLGDDTTLAMLRSAETFGLTGNQAQKAVQDAIAMQAAATGSAEGAENLIRLTAALTQGNTQQAMQFARMVPQLRGIRDESEFLAKAQQLVASGMATASAEASSSAGTMKQLKNAYGNLMEEVGKTVAEVIAPIIAGARKVVKWFQDLSPAVKEAVVVMAILTASAVALFVAINTGMVVFNMLSGGVLLVIGLIITAAAAVGGWVFAIGGVSKAWDRVKATVSAVYNWLLPIFRAIGGYGRAIWDQISQTAGRVWEFIVSIWEKLKTFLSETFSSILGDSDITWESIRGAIAVAFIFGEFMVRRFGSVCELVWAGLKLAWAQFTGLVVYFFRTVVPTVLNYFATNWRAIFTDAFNFVAAGFQNLLGNVERIGRNIPRLLRGQVSLADIWTPLRTGFQRTAAQLVIPQRVIDANEARLRAEFIAMGSNLVQDWETFRNQRLHEIFSEETPSATGSDNPMTPVLNQAKAVTAEIQKWDAVARFSAESFARISEYQDRLRMGTSTGRVSASTPPSVRAAAAVPMAIESQRPNVDSQPQLAELARLLTITNTILTAISTRPGMNFVPANVGNN